MGYVVFLIVLTIISIPPFYIKGNYMFFCFQFNTVLISSKLVYESNCSFRSSLSTFPTQICRWKTCMIFICQQSWYVFRAQAHFTVIRKARLVLLGTVDIVNKTTTFAEKQITTASCVMLISHFPHQLLIVTVLNCIYLRACYHKSIVKRKDRIYITEVWYMQIYFSNNILML